MMVLYMAPTDSVLVEYTARLASLLLLGLVFSWHLLNDLNFLQIVPTTKEKPTY